MSRKPIDLIGKKFGTLTVIEKTEERQNGGHVLWLCECDCGNTIKAVHYTLKNKKSCGCLKKKLHGKLTQQRLKELIYYDPETGIFTRLKNGKIIRGVNETTGYQHVHVNGKYYAASRLAWFYMEGYWPENEIDHKNRIRDDNRWINLRHVSRSCNVRNSSISRRNTSGITGVSWDNQYQNWRVHIRINDIAINLGRRVKKVDAARVRWNAEVKYGFPNCNTTSSAYVYLKEHGVAV